jgi:hypothetical protein
MRQSLLNMKYSYMRRSRTNNYSHAKKLYLWKILFIYFLKISLGYYSTSQDCVDSVNDSITRVPVESCNI